MLVVGSSPTASIPLTFEGNISERELILIYPIYHDEAKMLQKMGFKYGKDIHRTYSRYPKYYITETNKLMHIVQEHREKKVIHTYGE